MLTIRFFNGNPWNPLHLLIMAVTRSRVVHCDVVVECPYHSDVFNTGTIAFTTSFDQSVGFEDPSKRKPACTFTYGESESPHYPTFFAMMEKVFDTPYDYRAAIAYIWPWVRQSESRMNCVEVCLWAMRRAGLPTPRHLPTPGGLMRWCAKIEKEMK